MIDGKKLQFVKYTDQLDLKNFISNNKFDYLEVYTEVKSERRNYHRDGETTRTTFLVSYLFHDTKRNYVKI